MYQQSSFALLLLAGHFDLHEIKQQQSMVALAHFDLLPVSKILTDCFKPVRLNVCVFFSFMSMSDHNKI